MKKFLYLCLFVFLMFFWIFTVHGIKMFLKTIYGIEIVVLALFWATLLFTAIVAFSVKKS